MTILCKVAREVLDLVGSAVGETGMVTIVLLVRASHYLAIAISIELRCRPFRVGQRQEKLIWLCKAGQSSRSEVVDLKVTEWSPKLTNGLFKSVWYW